MSMIGGGRGRHHGENVLGDDGLAVVGKTFTGVRAGGIFAGIGDDQLIAELLMLRW